MQDNYASILCRHYRAWSVSNFAKVALLQGGMPGACVRWCIAGTTGRGALAGMVVGPATQSGAHCTVHALHTQCTLYAPAMPCIAEPCMPLHRNRGGLPTGGAWYVCERGGGTIPSPRHPRNARICNDLCMHATRTRAQCPTGPPCPAQRACLMLRYMPSS